MSDSIERLDFEPQLDPEELRKLYRLDRVLEKRVNRLTRRVLHHSARGLLETPALVWSDYPRLLFAHIEPIEFRAVVHQLAFDHHVMIDGYRTTEEVPDDILVMTGTITADIPLVNHSLLYLGSLSEGRNFRALYLPD